MAENDAPGMNFNETEWEFLAAIDALEYLNFDTSMASVRDDAAEIATIIVRRAQDLAAPDAPSGWVACGVDPNEPYMVSLCFETPEQANRFVNDFAASRDAVRQARRETRE